MTDDPILLLPYPRTLERREGASTGAPGLRPEHIDLSRPTDAAAHGPLAGHLTIDITHGACGTRPTDAHRYTLDIPADAGASIQVTAASAAGARHALATLRQLIVQFGSDLPSLHIEDHPALVTRGFMLDVSRDRIPTMRSLFELVDTLAQLKFNHLQLYTEHTFAYADHETVWRGWSPLTGDEIRRLDAYARERGIELAANQNCFGHLASWLRHPEYAHLAETHGDWVFDVWPRSGPFSLCPTDPASERFVRGLLRELLPHFSSNLVNIGCDETYDIAYGRSKDEVERRGRAAVYLEFVQKICAITRELGKRPMFWADIALSHPEAIADIPQDLISLAWGYEHDSPFDRWCRALTAAGREVWVCPGTSSWRSITGRTSERAANITNAAAHGAAAGATGFLLCDWGDTGHHQQWPITLIALGQAAEAAWLANPTLQPTAARTSLHLLADPTLRVGPWLETVGDAGLRLRATCGELARPGVPSRLRNQSALFIDLFKPEDQGADVGRLEDWEQARMAVENSMASRPLTQSQLINDELEHMLRYATLAAQRAAARRRPGGLTATDRERLLTQLPPLIENHRRLWLARSRSGGLDHSVTFFDQIAANIRGAAAVTA